MKDWLGREIEYLRVSVTQNCNLQCIYCMPEGRDEEKGCGDKSCNALSPGEFESVIRVMAGMGIKKVRITGGEPLTRPDICEIVSRISGIPGIDDLSMTTNGITLEKMVRELKAAGLKRLNISIDSLKPEKFAYITRGGSLHRVMDGVKQALEVGLRPVKINTVLIKGVNDDEIDDFMRLAEDSPVEVRFIELMPVGRFGEENADKIVYNSHILRSHPELIPCEEKDKGQPAKYYKIEGYLGRIGFISPMSHKFCHCCNRLRLTCDGKIKPCLGDNGEVDIASVLHNEPDRLEERIAQVIYHKPEGHHFEGSFASKRSMDRIGG